MNHNMKLQLKKYFRDIKAGIPKDYPCRERILNQIQKSITNFLEEQPEASFSDILEKFGNPIDIASSFIDDMPGEEIAEILKKEKHKKFIILTICITICIFAASISCYLYLYPPVKITETVTIYKETEYIETETQNQ